MGSPKRTERKIQFSSRFISTCANVFAGIIRTDDPVEAIEQMEIELSRLTEELTNREQKLAISSRSVANFIRKTIGASGTVFAGWNRACKRIVGQG
ncbi:hypothetical protein ACNKHQ_05435 [Shigella flexneri]